MCIGRRAAWLGLVVVTVAVLAVGLVPRWYHRWWWWDILVHALAATLLAAWAAVLGLSPRLRWPAFVAAMLGWEWLELATPLLFSPTRQDVLSDLTVNVVVFGVASLVISLRGPSGTRDVRPVDNSEH